MVTIIFVHSSISLQVCNASFEIIHTISHTHAHAHTHARTENAIGPEGATTLAPALKHLSNLTVLELRGTFCSSFDCLIAILCQDENATHAHYVGILLCLSLTFMFCMFSCRRRY